MTGTESIRYTEPTAIDEALIPDIAEFIKRYVVLPSEAHATILAYWVLHTWTFDSARSTPYIYVNSADKQSGKTRLIEVLEILVRDPMRATNVTPSVLFRAIDTLRPCILLDEVDTVWSGGRNEIMRGILNGGYRKGGSVWRIKNQQPAEFNTFCPKLLAGIHNGFMPDTISDRCIPIKLKRKKRGQECERFYAMDVAASEPVRRLQDRIAAFVSSSAIAVAVQRPQPCDGISDRQAEITEPLLALASVLGQEATVRSAVADVFRDMQDVPSEMARLLATIRDAFRGEDKVFTATLLERLGSGISGKQLAVWLTPVGVSPKDIRIANRTGSGYDRRDFEEAFGDVLDA